MKTKHLFTYLYQKKHKTIPMNKLLLLVLFLFCVTFASAQENNFDFTIELNKTELTPEQEKKIDAAFTAMEAVRKTGNYIQSLTKLLTDGTITFPVGIVSPEGGYELIVHKIKKIGNSNREIMYATCAFTFKESNQRIAFEGQIEINGENGFDTSGKLTLIAPVKRNLGKQSAIIIREGTSAAFGCGGIENFDARLTWVVTSDKITPVNAQGVKQSGGLGVNFDAHFEDFDNYVVSVGIDKRFVIKGLDDIVFRIQGATIDQSDAENSAMTQFPTNYFSSADLATQALWQGVSISEASVSLPSFFKQKNSNERVVVGLQQVLFDENGFSGNVFAQNIIPSSEINPESWDMSLTGFQLNMFKNTVAGFGLSGDVNIPPFGKHSLLPYTASYNSLLEQCEFRVNMAGEYDFPALRSTLTLSELTTIQLQFRDHQLYPSINATGKLTVNAPMNEKDSTQVFSVPDIDFENLVISREAPYFQVGRIGVTGSLRSPRVAGFEVSIDDISGFKDGSGEGLRFTGNIGFVNSGIAISGQAGIKLFGDYERWKFNKVAVDKVNVNYRSNAFSLQGGVWFKNGDAVYGNGFRGDLQMSIIDKFTFDAVGIFGKKDDYRYFLADVFFEMTPTNGIPIPPVLSFYGFGGGLYQKMQQSGKSSVAGAATGSAENYDFGKSLSGINYVPDPTVGLGLMASAKFALKTSENAFNAKVGFEMQFNSSGGLNFLQLRGDGAFMDLPEKWGNLADNVGSYTDKMSGKKLPQKGTKAELENKVPENKSSGILSASMLFEYDNINKCFNADMSTYLNAYGIIKGIGANDRFGWANAYISPDSWHMYLGTPYNRCGINVLNLAKLDGYFMLGDGIPALPPPPNNVLQFLSESKIAQLNKRNEQQLGAGKGIALGASLQTGFDASFLLFYAKMGLGLGTEFMLTNLNGATCAGISGTPGLNGWYAQGQAWAYVEAAVGLQAKLLGKTRRFPILDIGTGTLLEAKGPNPFYFAGTVGGRYAVLGGLIKGTCNFEFEIGENCKPTGGSAFGEDVIAQLTPSSGARDVNVFAAPQAVFNIPIEKAITIDEDNGTKGTYKVSLEEFTIKYKNGSTVVTKSQQINEEGSVCMLSLKEPFESQKDVELYVKVSFKKKNGNNWVAVTGDNGKPVYEEKRASFKTGDRPKEILPEHVVYSYPLNRQYNFYRNEYKQGYLLLSQNYTYLFTDEKPVGFDQKLRIGTADGQSKETNFSYTTKSLVSGVEMEINFSLSNAAFENNKIYKLAIVNIPQKSNASITSNIRETTTQLTGTEAGTAEITKREATGTLENLAEKEIYALTFKTSSHNTFADKIHSFEEQKNSWRDPTYPPFIHNIGYNLPKPEELFDAYEMGSAGVNAKMINFTAQVQQTPWFTQTLYGGMYRPYTNVPAPADKISILQVEAPNKLLTDDEIRINAPSGYGTIGVMRYELAYYCAVDMYNAKEQIGAKVVRNQNITAAETAVLNQDFPPVVFHGNYPVTATYILPGKNTVTSSVNFNMYNPIRN